MEVLPRDKGLLHMVPMTGGWRFVGEIDLSNADALRGVLATNPDSADLHLDLSDLTFIDVTGTATLVASAARLSGGGRSLVLHRPPNTLRRILEVCWAGEPCPGLSLADS